MSEFENLFHAACDKVEGLSGQLRIDDDVSKPEVTDRSKRLMKLADILQTVQIEAESDEESSEPDA